MKRIVFIWIAFLPLVLGAQSGTLRYPVSDSTMNKMIEFPGINSEESMEKPYVIMVSLDGYRYDYTDLYGADVFDDVLDDLFGNLSSF